MRRFRVLVALVSVSSLAACSSAPGRRASTSQVPRNAEVRLVPDLAAGIAGWCMAMEVTVQEERTTGCATPKTSSGPLTAESCIGDGNVVTAFVLTREDVAWVSGLSVTRVATDSNA